MGAIGACGQARRVAVPWKKAQSVVVQRASQPSAARSSSSARGVSTA
jgi:hypothetical protein